MLSRASPRSPLWSLAGEPVGHQRVFLSPMLFTALSILHDPFVTRTSAPLWAGCVFCVLARGSWSWFPCRWLAFECLTVPAVWRLVVSPPGEVACFCSLGFPRCFRWPGLRPWSSSFLALVWRLLFPSPSPPLPALSFGHDSAPSSGFDSIAVPLKHTGTLESVVKDCESLVFTKR